MHITWSIAGKQSHLRRCPCRHVVIKSLSENSGLSKELIFYSVLVQVFLQWVVYIIFCNNYLIGAYI